MPISKERDKPLALYRAFLAFSCLALLLIIHSQHRVTATSAAASYLATVSKQALSSKAAFTLPAGLVLSV